MAISVLIVDDNPDIRATIRYALEEERYHVREAENGMAALAILRASMEHTVVLLDHLMPDMTGTDILGIIAGDPELAHRHSYVMMTADGRVSSPVIDTAPTLPPVPVVAKPFDIDDLLSAVRDASQVFCPSSSSPHLHL